MGLIHIYNSVSNEHITKRGTGSLRALLPDFDFAHAVILREGKRLTPDYCVTENDIIFVRSIPGFSIGGFSFSWSDIGWTALAIATGGISSTIRAKQLADEAEEAMKKAQAAGNTDSTVNALPFLRGAKNASALGNTIPFIIGETFYTPMLLNDAFYSIAGTDGEKQYLNLILYAGQASQAVKSVSIGDVEILDLSETDIMQLDGVHTMEADSTYYDENNIIEIARGHALTHNAFTQKVKSEYIGEEIAHEYGEDAEPYIYQCPDNTQKIEFCIAFDALRAYTGNVWGERSVYILPEISIDNGETWHGCIQEWSAADIKGDFITSGCPGVKISRNTNTTVRFTCTIDNVVLEAAKIEDFRTIGFYGNKILLRLTRTNEKLESNSQETATLLYVNCYCYDAKKSSENNLVPCAPLESPFLENACLIGIRMIANDSTKDMLDEFNIITQGLAPSYDTQARAWRTTTETGLLNCGGLLRSATDTRNVACWLLEVLLSDLHKHSQFALDEIDLDSFSALYEYCAEQGFYADGVLTKETKKRDLLTQLLTLCNSSIYTDADGRYTIAIDKEEETPVALLNAQSVKSITVSKSLEKKVDGLKVTFINRESWQTDTAYVMVDGGEKGLDDTCTAASYEFATTYDHVYKLAQRALRQDRLQPREITVTVGREGDYYPLYSTVMLQLEQLKQGLHSAVIHEVIYNAHGEIYALRLSDYVDLGAEAFLYYETADGEKYEVTPTTAAQDYHQTRFYGKANPNRLLGLVIQVQNAGKKFHLKTKVYGENYTRILYLETPIAPATLEALPARGNIVSFGYLNSVEGFDSVYNMMKICAVKPNDDGGYTLTLRDYSPSIYEYGIIPEYKSNLTTPERTSKLGAAEISTKELLKSAKIEASTELAAETAARIAKDAALEAQELSDVLGVELSTQSISFNYDSETKALYSQTKTVTAKLKRAGGSVYMPFTSASVTTTGTAFFTCSAAAVSADGLTATFTLSATQNNTFTGACTLTVILSYGGTQYTATVAVDAKDTSGYKGTVASIEALNALTPAYGDFITWTGADAASTLVEGGIFYRAQVYRYTGGAPAWSIETGIDHNASALEDVLGALDTYMQQFSDSQIDSAGSMAALTANRNAYSTQFMNVLAVNRLFCRFIAAQDAFIRNIRSLYVTLKEGGYMRSENFDGAIENGAITNAGTSGWAISSNGNSVFTNVQIRGSGSQITGGTVDVDTVTANTVNGGTVNANTLLTIPKGEPASWQAGSLYMLE